MTGTVSFTSEQMQTARDAIEHYYRQGWTDGLPVVPPIQEFVDEFLAQTSRAADEVVFRVDHLDRQCTVRDAAINAVMAGCRPEYFPVVLAALQAFSDAGPAMAQSTTGQAQMFIINGPVRERIGVNCTHNILGPGDRANATIGRTMRLVILNVLDVRPHDLDQSTQGTPAKYVFCFGENEEDSPWEPYHVEHGFPAETSVVTARMVRSTLHVEHRSTQEPREILETIADSMSYSGGIYEAPPFNTTASSVVIMGPEHARIVAGGGWSKADVRQFLWERWGKHIRDLRRFGKVIELESEPDDAFIHEGGPEDVKVVVAGADNAGVTTVTSGFVSRQGMYAVEER
jgi:hypothetical protein